MIVNNFTEFITCLSSVPSLFYSENEKFNKISFSTNTKNCSCGKKDYMCDPRPFKS